MPPTTTVLGIQLHIDVGDDNGIRQAGRGDKAHKVGAAPGIRRRGAEQRLLTL